MKRGWIEKDEKMRGGCGAPNGAAMSYLDVSIKRQRGRARVQLRVSKPGRASEGQVVRSRQPQASKSMECLSNRQWFIYWEQSVSRGRITYERLIITRIAIP
ncbi:hypothetical protein V565_032620 [Rhizoctonia solani 123E]|uniref:Uncharacterized protein n=1 Tax=Rhizoctonia solani 123E TaxID=1423351 RepID=A0A074S1X4_9AGAM|nr:hypothetical protein V565_032620 [Rhizoctonia solani 123E]